MNRAISDKERERRRMRNEKRKRKREVEKEGAEEVHTTPNNLGDDRSSQMPTEPINTSIASLHQMQQATLPPHYHIFPLLHPCRPSLLLDCLPMM